MSSLRFFILIPILLLTACTNNAPSSNNSSSSSSINSSSSSNGNGSSNNTPAPNTPEPSAPLSENEAVAHIRERYQATMNDLSLDKLARQVVEFECEDEPLFGQTTYFSNADGALRMIENSYILGDHYSVTDQYFLEDGNLYFVYRVEGDWTFGDAPDATIDHTIEYRSYVYDQTLVRCLKKEYSIASNKENQPKPSAIPNEKTDCPSLDALKEKIVILEERRASAKTGKVLLICTAEMRPH